MFKPAPQTLLPHDELRRLEEMKQIVARATSDMMMTPDWGLTMQLVDLTNGTRDARVLTELVEMLQERLKPIRNQQIGRPQRSAFVVNQAMWIAWWFSGFPGSSAVILFIPLFSAISFFM